MDIGTGSRYEPGNEGLLPDSGMIAPYTYHPPTGAGAASKKREYRRRTARRNRDRNNLRMIIVGAVSGIIAALLVILLMPWAFGVSPLDLVTGKLADTSVETRETVKVVDSDGGASSVMEIASTVTPAIVNIDIRAERSYGRFLGYEEGTGSGVIYREDGYIITNNHVVEDAQEITVTLAGGEELEGRIVGADADSEIAVIKVDRSGLPTIELGDSDDLLVGELAVAVGSPFGFEHSVTAGIISALDRSISATTDQPGGQVTTVLADLIQTDAAINPGNSGGALCNSEGKLIGINTVIATAAGGSEGVGFAIPINDARAIADSLIAA